MKKLFYDITLMAFFGLLNIHKVYGDGYFMITVGNNAKSSTLSIGGEAGWIDQKGLVGIGISKTLPEGDWVLVDQSGTYYNGVRIYEKPGAEYEGYGAIGIGIIKNLLLIGAAGYSVETIKTKSETKSNGVLIYNIDLGTEASGKGHFSLSGQLQYKLYGFIIRAGYHNRRGIIAGIGFSF